MERLDILIIVATGLLLTAILLVANKSAEGNAKNYIKQTEIMIQQHSESNIEPTTVD